MHNPPKGYILLALGLVLVAVVVGQYTPERVYTVAQVRANLARQPAAWAGRTLLVRGVAGESSWAEGSVGVVYPCNLRFIGDGTQSCPLVAPNGATVYVTLTDDSVQPDLVRPSSPFATSRPANPLTLVLAVQAVAPNPLIALARRLPPLARFLAMQGGEAGGVPHLYRIRLRPAGSNTNPCTIPSLFGVTRSIRENCTLRPASPVPTQLRRGRIGVIAGAGAGSRTVRA